MNALAARATHSAYGMAVAVSYGEDNFGLGLASLRFGGFKTGVRSVFALVDEWLFLFLATFCLGK